ncbi:MAG: L,D-transpeptidase family protein [Novosphingobium sp.]|uniref:L,D-transpeptidase family protein n=1 Tax=Novosphingobium sp. TaxID=1874826 RepID=UPI001D3AFDA2|nr:L,D-transpeptidase family protein [Novosphingobium sp.]MCB2056392.1 L,D-transpeptidase family protein [Novosphingobium sp.]MCP5386939.1 L,D-transpeptidase family protein [Novosphingobium sp.]
MKRCLLALCALLVGAGEPAAPQWSVAALGELRTTLAAMPGEGLPAPDTAELDAAWRASDPVRVDRAATRLALKVARLELLGSAPDSARQGWKILDTDRNRDLEADLAAALVENRLGIWLGGLSPRHPDYALLRAAYGAEADPVRRAALARNMERWRWLPRDPGDDFLLVNAAGYEVSRWTGGKRAGTWRVIVGKTRSPTPVFSATVTGVTINPWWEVPASIVRESVGALIRHDPALARSRGYIWSGGKVRQKPGESNALGRMKLVMPNPYSVYLHDTPNRDLFAEERRAFSHGCVRVGDALDFASALLAPARSRADVDALVAAGETVTLDLPRPLPVYVAYFTVASDADGRLIYFDDVYGRDSRVKLARSAGETCDV